MYCLLILCVCLLFRHVCQAEIEVTRAELVRVQSEIARITPSTPDGNKTQSWPIGRLTCLIQDYVRGNSI